MRDREGNELKIGDRVRFTWENYDYEFTIESTKRPWASQWMVWGPEIPPNRRYTTDGNKNHHSTQSCLKIEPKNTWGESKIRFHFK